MVALMKPDNQIVDTIIQGDCLEVLRTLDACSVDAIVTDPPAGIGFMMSKDRTWDSDKGGRDAWIAWLSQIMAGCLRVLKPGGHAFVWALPRTSHWTALALEDAGFTIREKCYHLFGSGFPKSKNLGNGVGSALKPAVEEWILCRKPLSESSLEANYAKWGTGGLAIDQCRVGTSDTLNIGTGYMGYHGADGSNPGQQHPQGRFPSNLLLSHSLFCVPLGTRKVKGTAPRGKPSHGEPMKHSEGWGYKVNGSGIHYNDSQGMEEVQAWECTEDCPIRLLDEQSGSRSSHHNGTIKIRDFKGWQKSGSLHSENVPVDQGGASRYFTQFSPQDEVPIPFLYQSKASRSEKNRGCEGLPEQVSRSTVERHHKNYTAKSGMREDLPRQNNHPTVKPQALLSWLSKLICPPGGIILDPFGGSGSQAVACINNGFHFILIEQDASYCEIARVRVAHAFGEVAP